MDYTQPALQDLEIIIQGSSYLDWNGINATDSNHVVWLKKTAAMPNVWQTI